MSEPTRVLIVEDDPSQLQTLSGILSGEGFAVRTCSTAYDALLAVAEQEFVAAVIDLRLPDQQGTELIEQVRAVNDRVRVIIYTGYGSFGSAKKAVNKK